MGGVFFEECAVEQITAAVTGAYAPTTFRVSRPVFRTLLTLALRDFATSRHCPRLPAAPIERPRQRAASSAILLTIDVHLASRNPRTMPMCAVSAMRGAVSVNGLGVVVLQFRCIGPRIVRCGTRAEMS